MQASALIKALPKAELHLHIEGTLEPQMMWDLASKHGITLPYENVDAIQQAYQFDNLQGFLDLYYQGTEVLRDESDFYDLLWAYLLRCKANNIVHTEIMFDPQSHTSSGIEFATFMNGFIRAKQQAKNELGLSVELIMSFLRHLSEEDAIQVFHQAAPYYDHIIAVGLDSSELHHPPQKFARLFNMAREAGFKCVAHAGEEGPPDYIWGAIDTLKVDRIDHGVRAIEDAKLMAYLQDSALPLTVCPLSNVKLCVFNHMSKHTLLNMLDNGLMVTVNSDDPSYFGGYLNDNFVALHEHLNMSQHQLVRLIKNSFKASFLPETDKQYWLAKIDDWVR